MRARFTIELPHDQTLTMGDRTLIAGVVNVTPDSFSDGGKFIDVPTAIDRAIAMEAEGADIIEVGAESTRPGAVPVNVNEELGRILPVIEGLVGRVKVPISVDTYKGVVAVMAVSRGASIINDVGALTLDPFLPGMLAGTKAALVLMHMRGTPETMQNLPPSEDIFAEIKEGLAKSVALAEDAGISRNRIIIDPGIGFGKTFDQNLQIINRLDYLTDLRLPIMVGTSRKGFIGHLTGRDKEDRIFGTAATVAACVLRGAHLVRVHDVKEMADVVKVADAIADAF